MELITFLTEQWMLVALFLALAYTYQWREKAKAGAGLSVHQLTSVVNQGNAQIVDLRDNAEFQAGHIVDAMNIPHAQLQKQLPELERHKNKTLVLVDKLGQHTGHAGRLLRDKGFEVVRLNGGMAEWTGQNLPVIKGKQGHK